MKTMKTLKESIIWGIGFMIGLRLGGCVGFTVKVSWRDLIFGKGNNRAEN